MKRALLVLAMAVPLALAAAAIYHPPMNQICDGPYPLWAGDPCSDNWTNPSVLDYL